VRAPFVDDEGFAKRLDEQDPLRRFRERFAIPPRADGEPSIYFNGNSLGLMPVKARECVEQELDDWARLGVDGHFHGKTPWYSYHEVFRETGARLVGARPGEVVMMNSLTVNLHLMMATFYRPTPERHAILIEDEAFPSDTYAMRTQARHHRLDPDRSVIVAKAGDDLEDLLKERGREIAVVMLGGVHYFSGRLLPMQRIVEAGHRAGCIVGFDLAHAAGNVPLSLHDWDVDFAAWCSYKYLNAGPGAVAGCFVHERHGKNKDLPRLAGWWGNDPKTRFRMHLEPEFLPREGADGWQLSNPPILAMAPLRASLELFDEAGLTALRAKSVVLTGYLEWLLEQAAGSPFQVITPPAPEERGCQLSLRVLDRPRERFRDLENAGVVGDFREPDVIRLAPVPLYNTFHEVWRCAKLLTA
jgi:kynureninase